MGRKASIRVTLTALLLVVTLVMAGCPAGSQQKSATAMRDFAYSLQAFQTGEIAFHQVGKIDDATHSRLQAGILSLATLGPQVDAAIAANNKAGLLSAIDSSIVATDDMIATGIIGIKDPTTKLQLQTLLLTIRVILANGKALVA